MTVAADTNVIAWLHVPLETFAYGPADVVLRKTRYPPPDGSPGDAPHDRAKLVAVGLAAVPAPAVFNVTAWAVPVPLPEVVT